MFSLSTFLYLFFKFFVCDIFIKNTVASFSGLNPNNHTLTEGEKKGFN